MESFRRGAIGLHEIPAIDCFLWWDPLLSLRFHKKRPLRVDPVLQNIYGLGGKRALQPTWLPSLSKWASCVTVLGNLRQYLLGRSRPVFPPGPIGQGLGHFPRAITDQTPLPPTSITWLRSVDQSCRSFGKTPTIVLAAWPLLAQVRYASHLYFQRFQVRLAFSFLHQKQRFFLEPPTAVGVSQATPQASSNPSVSLQNFYEKIGTP